MDYTGGTVARTTFVLNDGAVFKRSVATTFIRVDFRRAARDYARTTPWLTYPGDGKYRPLGPAPRSTEE